MQVVQFSFFDVAPSVLLVNMKLAHEKPPSEKMGPGEKACRNHQDQNPKDFLALLGQLERDHWTKVIAQAKMNEAEKEKAEKKAPVEEELPMGPQEAMLDEMYRKLSLEWKQ